jgi:hypothetical protein
MGMYQIPNGEYIITSLKITIQKIFNNTLLTIQWGFFFFFPSSLVQNSCMIINNLNTKKTNCDLFYMYTTKGTTHPFKPMDLLLWRW